MALTPKHDRINRALDEELNLQALSELQSMLESEPDDAALYASLRRVDDLLRQPPMAKPSPDFASKVMVRIKAGEHAAYAPERRRLPWLVWGLSMSVAVLVPVIAVLAMIVAPALGAPGALIAVLSGAIDVLGFLSNGLNSLLLSLGNLIASYPMVPALTLTLIPMVMLWAWLVWFMQQQNRPATVIIKVQAL